MEERPTTTGLLMCSTEVVLPGWPLFPRCQRYEGHDGMHFWMGQVNGEAFVEVRW